MNHSFYSADRTTHLKIVVVALIGAMIVAGIGIGAHFNGGDGLAPTGHASVMKVGKSAMMASGIQLSVR